MVEPVTRGGWEGRARRYDEPEHVQHRGLLDWVASVASQHGPTSALDLGCGTGALTRALARRVPHVEGMDGAKEMVSRAQSLGPNDIAYRWGDVLRDVGTAPQELVTARLLLRHLPDPGAAVAQWARQLVPGGRLAIAEGVPPADDPASPVVTLYREVMAAKHGAPKAPLLASDIAALMLAAGLEPVTVHQRYTDGNSCRAWCESGGCDEETTRRILDLHRQSPLEVRQAYRMIDHEHDVLMRWRHVVVVGERVDGLERCR